MSAEAISAWRASLTASAPPMTDFARDAFPAQAAFIRERARFATVCGGRRGGKSEGVARWLLAKEAENHRAPCLYFTTTRKEAKRIIWQPLLELIAKHHLPIEPRESTLTLRRGGIDRVFLTGCDNQTEIGKMRGSGWGAVNGDEAQLFPSYLKPLIEESLTPALMDFDGALRLSGTPAPVPIGYFYDAVRSDRWAHHGWTPFENPHINARKLLDDVLALRGITEDHPSIQREFHGRWVYDSSAMVFAYDPRRNAYPEGPLAPLTDFVIGVDLGFDDADAIAVLGWRSGDPGLYLVEEHVLAKQSITGLTDRLREIHAKYEPLACVVDTGGLGKKIADEVARRTGIPLQAADKARKLEHIELLNDALRTGKFFARTDSRFAQDALLVEWDKSNPEKPRISDRFHSDVCDAVLYAFMRSLHWLHVPAVVAPPIGSREAFRAEEAAMLEKMERQVRERQEQPQAFGTYREERQGMDWTSARSRR